MNLNELNKARELAKQLDDVIDAMANLPGNEIIEAACKDEPFCLQLVFHNPDGMGGVGAPIPPHLVSNYAGRLRDLLDERRRGITNALSDLGISLSAAEAGE